MVVAGMGHLVISHLSGFSPIYQQFQLSETSVNASVSPVGSHPFCDFHIRHRPIFRMGGGGGGIFVSSIG